MKKLEVGEFTKQWVERIELEEELEGSVEVNVEDLKRGDEFKIIGLEKYSTRTFISYTNTNRILMSKIEGKIKPEYLGVDNFKVLKLKVRGEHSLP